MVICIQCDLPAQLSEVEQVVRNEELEQARCESITDNILEELGVSAWMTVRHKYSTRNDEDARIGAETTTDWEYRQATIEWVLPITSQLTNLELHRLAVHEVVHTLLAPMESLVKCVQNDPKALLCELAVENVTRAILEVLSTEDVAE